VAGRCHVPCYAEMQGILSDTTRVLGNKFDQTFSLSLARFAAVLLESKLEPENFITAYTPTITAYTPTLCIIPLYLGYPHLDSFIRLYLSVGSIFSANF
jgi:hypothetical protein